MPARPSSTMASDWLGVAMRICTARRRAISSSASPVPRVSVILVLAVPLDALANGVFLLAHESRDRAVGEASVGEENRGRAGLRRLRKALLPFGYVKREEPAKGVGDIELVRWWRGHCSPLRCGNADIYSAE